MGRVIIRLRLIERIQASVKRRLREQKNPWPLQSNPLQQVRAALGSDTIQEVKISEEGTVGGGQSPRPTRGYIVIYESILHQLF